jgi:hypothetical protein
MLHVLQPAPGHLNLARRRFRRFLDKNSQNVNPLSRLVNPQCPGNVTAFGRELEQAIPKGFTVRFAQFTGILLELFHQFNHFSGHKVRQLN